MCRSEPSCPLVQKCRGWVHDTFVQAGADVEMGWKLFATFQQTGLPSPEMFLGSPVGAGPDFTHVQIHSRDSAQPAPYDGTLWSRFGKRSDCR